MIPVSAMEMRSAAQERDQSVDSARQQVLYIARIAEARYSQVLGVGAKAVELLRQSESVVDFDAPGCTSTLETFSTSHPAYDTFLVANVDGVVVCAGQADVLGVDISDREYFQHALRASGVISSGPLISRPLGLAVVVLAAPVLNPPGARDGVITGVLVLGLKTEWLATTLGGADLPPDTVLVIKGSTGEELLRLPADASPPRGDLLTASRELKRGDHVDGTVTVSVSRDEVVATANDRLIWDLLTIGIAAVAMGLLSFGLVTTTVQRPLNQLNHLAERLTAGDRTVRAKSYVGDAPEVARLANALNRSAESLAEQEQRLRAIATTDSLTGLLNRTGFVEALEARMGGAKRSDTPIVVGVVGVRSFTGINATLGFDVGDRALQALGARLGEVVGVGALVARLGGDTFVFARETDSEDEPLDVLAGSFEARLAEPLAIESVVLRLRTYTGIALVPDDGHQPHELVRRAELASRRARGERQRWTRFDVARDEPRPEQVYLLGELQGALDRSELEVLYQPKVRLIDAQISGLEALVRWHLNGEDIPPSQFIPLAERAGMVPAITRAVLDVTVRQLAEWHRAGIGVRTSVNVSVLDLADEGFSRFLIDLLTAWSVPPSLLELEITETALMGEPLTAKEATWQLHSAGITFAVDDFGVGFAPLTYLRMFPLAAIKIDRAFVSDILENEESRSIVASTVHLARGLGLEVVAEGVEDLEVAAVLRDLGCDHVQGFAFGRPAPAADVEAYLRGEMPAHWTLPDRPNQQP